MDSFTRNLQFHLPNQPARALSLPARGLLHSLEHSSSDEKSRSLTNKMRIGTAEERRKAIDMADLRKQRPSDARRRGVGQRSRWKQQEDRPHPGNCTNGNFETGLPVDSDRWWILFNPAIHLGNGFLRIALVAAKKIGLCQT